MIWVILSVLLRNTREPLLENIKKADPVWKTGNSLKPKLIFGIVPGGNAPLPPPVKKNFILFSKSTRYVEDMIFFAARKRQRTIPAFSCGLWWCTLCIFFCCTDTKNRIFVIQAGYRLVIPGPLCCASRVKWMMEWLLIRLSSPWQKTVRTYCSRTPQKIRNLFFSFVSSILTKFLVCYNKIRS